MLAVVRLDGVVLDRADDVALHVHDAVLLAVAHDGIAASELTNLLELTAAAQLVGLGHVVDVTIFIVHIRLVVGFQHQVAHDGYDDDDCAKDDVALQLASVFLIGSLVGCNLCLHFTAASFHFFLCHLLGFE